MLIEVLPETGKDKWLKNSRLQILHKTTDFASRSWSGFSKLRFQLQLEIRTTL
jgi:hypothetical protein